jgi:hypothetical protein
MGEVMDEEEKDRMIQEVKDLRDLIWHEEPLHDLAEKMLALIPADIPTVAVLSTMASVVGSIAVQSAGGQRAPAMLLANAMSLCSTAYVMENSEKEPENVH